MTVITSAEPTVEPAEVPVHELVLGGAAARGSHPALVDGTTGQTIGYAELAGMVDRFAAGLAEAGLARGDVIALHSPNTILFPVVLLGASRAGVVVTTLNALSTAQEIAEQLTDARARWLVTVSALLPTAEEAAARAGVEQVWVCDTEDGHRSVRELLASTAEPPEVDVDLDEDLFVLPYSSGTTGRPKGVMLTHRSVGTNSNQVLRSWSRVTGDDRVLGVLPFFHIFGMCILLNYLRVGGTLVVLPRFEVDSFLSALAEYRITRLYAVPPIVLALAKHPAVDSYDLSSLREVLSAAAPLDPRLGEACARRIGTRVVQGYGMTELSPCSHLVADDVAGPVPGSVGTLVAGTQARLVDPVTGADVATGDVGELWIRGPQVMKGYFGRPEDTAAMIDADGWLHTGDLARVDADGYFFIVDRVKELIKYRGYQVPPAELEAVLLAHPEIADAAVVGCYDDNGDEVPKAFVVPSPGRTLDADAVMAYVAGKVAPYKKVRRVEFVDVIPRAASGKILRRELRERPAG
ncbi:4-coumarate--CoA ligase family protein [Gandjariella thermophila]|uniref:AMP-dependent synthetase n=1 Tax=Gandjariella thermophila TaxID=1931992 RepID=A0A4D4IWV7_9PSEU|nr:4-coumarate--CoA ligase family protein [Gandjariella thermophila]GDY28825.1 AMP-dependent synthetase [Gandjariella thermophila]